MTFTEHLAFGITTGTITTTYFHYTGLCDDYITTAIIFGGILVGNILPDIDNQNAIISKMCPLTKFVSKFITKFCAHRGLIHYSLFWIMLAIILLPKNFYLIGLFIGVFGHLFLDSFTYQGIPGLTWIINRKSRFRLLPKCFNIYVGTLKSKIVTFLLCVGITSFVVYLNLK